MSNELVLDLDINSDTFVADLSSVIDAVTEYTDTIKDSSAVVDEYTSLQDSLKAVTNDLNRPWNENNTVLDDFISILGDVSGLTKDSTDIFSEWADELGLDPSIVDPVKDFGTQVENFSKKVSESKKEIGAFTDAAKVAALSASLIIEEETYASADNFSAVIGNLSNNLQTTTDRAKEVAEKLGLDPKIVAAFDGIKTTIGDLAQKASDMGYKVEAVKEKMSAFGDAAKTAGDSAAQFLNKDTFTNANNFSTAVRDLEGNLNNVTDRAKEFADEIGLDPAIVAVFDDVKVSISDMADRASAMAFSVEGVGQSASDVAGGLKGLFSKETLGDPDLAADAIDRVGSATSSVVGHLKDIGTQVGLPQEFLGSFDEANTLITNFTSGTSSVLRAGADIGESASKAAEGVQKLLDKNTYQSPEGVTNAIDQINNASQEMLTNMQSIGETLGLPPEVINSFGQAGELISDVSQRASTVTTSLFTMKEETEKAAESFKYLFSPGSQASFELVKESVGGIQDAVTNAYGAFKEGFTALGFDPSALSGLEAVGGHINDMVTEGLAAGQKFYDMAHKAKGVLEDLGKKAGPMGQKLGSMLEKLGPKISKIGEKLGKMVEKLGPKMGSAFGKLGGFLDKFGKKVGGMGGKLGGMFAKFGGKLGKLAGKIGKYGGAMAGAFSMGWGIGRKIAEFFKLDEAVESFFSNALDKVGLMPKAMEVELGEGAIRARKLKKEMAEALNLDPNTTGITKLRQELFMNKDAFEKLSDAAKKNITEYAKKHPVLSKLAYQEEEMKKKLMGNTEELGKNALSQQKVSDKLHISEKALAKTASSLNIMTDQGLKKLNKEAFAMVAVWDHQNQQMDGNMKVTDQMKDAVRRLMDQYVQNGEKVPEGLQKIADKHDIVTTKQKEWNDKVEKMTESLGLLTNGGLKELNQESSLLVDTVNRNKNAFDGNSQAMEKMKERIQQQLDKYKGFDEVPEKLRRLASEYGVISSEEEKVFRATTDLKKALDGLGGDSMKKLNNESQNLTKYINDNTSSMDMNSAQADAVKDAIQRQLDKYKDMKDVPKDLQELAEKWGVIDEKTGLSTQALEEYSKSLGFVKREDVTEEMKKMAAALEANAKQYKENPKLMEALLKRMKELEDQAKQSGATIPKSYTDQKTAINDVKNAADDLVEKQKKQREESDKQKDAADKLKKEISGLSTGFKNVGNMLGFSDEQMLKFSKSTAKVGGTLSDISGGGKEVLGFLTDTGLVSGKTAEALGGLLDGIGSIGAGFSELATNPIGGAMKILGGVVKSVTNIFKLFSGDGVGEAIDRERELVDITEETEKKIRDLEEQLGDTHAATSMLMDEIIKEAEINNENFADYAQRTRDILADLDNGTLSVKETQESMGKAWNELLGEAQRLGTEGSKEMIALLGDVRGRGLEVAEMQEYVNQKLESGVKALETYLSTFADSGAIQEQIASLTAELAEGTLSAEEAAEKQAMLAEKQLELARATEDVTSNWSFMQTAAMSTFHALEAQGHSFVEIVGMMQGQLSSIGEMAQANGLEIHEGLQAMTNLSTFISQNEELANRIESTRIMMESLGDSAFMTGNDFQSFADQTALQFEDIMTRTEDQEMALRLISPALEDIIKYSKSYGFTIDDNTQALIDQAREEGVLAKEQKSHHEITNELLLSIAEALGAKIPEGLRRMAGEFDVSMRSIQNETGKWGRGLGDIEKQLTNGLPGAVSKLDKHYTDKMTGHSIVTETGKWKYSLEEVNGILGRDLIDTASNLDDKYGHVMGDLNTYLENTSKEGYKARLSFDEMVDELVVLKDAYDNLAMVEGRTDGQDNLMADYKRQIEELSAAIEESAPTLENYSAKFNKLKSELSGDIGVDTQMIGIAKGLRSQGLSTDEIDNQISGALTSGAKGMKDWIISAEDQEEFENSQAIVMSYFTALQTEGKSLTEIMGILGDSFEAVKGKTATDEMQESGFELSETFTQLYNLQQKMSENDDLIKGIEGLSGALHGMGDSMLYMTEETFVNFETASVNAFDKLKAAGFNQKQSLQLLAPLLKDLESYSSEYGYSLDSTTSKLLEEARNSGIIKEEQKSDTEKLIDANTQLAEIMQDMVNAFTDMGEASPFNMMEKEAKDLRNQILKMKEELDALYRKREKYADQQSEGYISAAIGFHGVLPKDTWFRLHKGERVDVWSPDETRRLMATPVSRMNLSDAPPSKRSGDIVFEHITIQSENGEEAVKEFMTAIKGNKYGVTNLIKKVAQ